MSTKDEINARMRLKSELDKMKRITGMGSELELFWSPDESSDRHGEVKDGIVMIYDVDEDEALVTLKHEFLDYLITKEIIKPLVSQINMQKKLMESLIYDRKEKLVHGLNELMGETIKG